jgi:hypothetical protein
MNIGFGDKLNITHQVAQMHFQGCRDSHQRIDGNIFFATLNIADVIVVKVGFFSQFLLTPFHALAIRPDVFAQNLSIFRNFNHPLKEP